MDALERARARYAGRCGYCGVEESDVGATLTTDHHRPRAHGGGDEEDNIVYCCPRCNEYKGSYWYEIDPPGIPLLHPGAVNLSDHLRELDEGRVEGITEEGDFLIHRLRLNRPQLVRHRARLRALRQALEELDAARRQVRSLEQEIVALTQKIAAAEDEITSGRH